MKYRHKTKCIFSFKINLYAANTAFILNYNAFHSLPYHGTDVYTINTPKWIIGPWHTAFPKWRPFLFQLDSILGVFTLFHT